MNEDGPACDPTGYLRISGEGAGGGFFPLTGQDVRVEALQADGSWLPVRGLVSARINVAADQMVTATLELEVGFIDLRQFLVAHAVHPTWWRRLLWWWRRTTRRLRVRWAP